MNFIQAVKSVFSQYVDFKGRAVRSEFWYFYLFVVLVNFIIIFAGGYEAAVQNIPTKEFNYITGVIAQIFHLVTIVPFLAVAVRRLHDVNRSGWFILLPLTIIGIIPYIYWLCKKGDNKKNRFGTKVKIK
jgi:uncharacterized membrane protein YhaH (DUF805 family)